MAFPGNGGIDVIDDRPTALDRDEKSYPPGSSYESKHDAPPHDDPFGNEDFAEVKYKTLSWW